MNIAEITKKIQLIENDVDRIAVKEELTSLLEGIKKSAEGLFEIAQSAERFRKNKLYKLIGFDTFEVFCQSVIGFTRKQVYLYLRIAEVTKKYPEAFDETMVVKLGPSKMDLVISGINRIDNSELSADQKNKRINELIGLIDYTMKVGEVEELVKKCMKGIR